MEMTIELKKDAEKDDFCKRKDDNKSLKLKVSPTSLNGLLDSSKPLFYDQLERTF